MLDFELQLIGVGIDLEIELEDALLAAGDREEIVGLVVRLDGGLGSGIIVLRLADDLELFCSVRRYGLGPLLSL